MQTLRFYIYIFNSILFIYLYFIPNMQPGSFSVVQGASWKQWAGSLRALKIYVCMYCVYSKLVGFCVLLD